jgi:NADH-quinone oxidoreductase E subunit
MIARQHKPFVFKNEDAVRDIIAQYPVAASAVMPLFHMAQTECDGWLPLEAVEYIAELLGISRIQALEVAHFYTMYNTTPVGRAHIQLCRTTPCCLNGAEELKEKIKQHYGIVVGETKNNITLSEVECLGACIRSPVVQVNEIYVEDATLDKVHTVVKNVLGE